MEHDQRLNGWRLLSKGLAVRITKRGFSCYKHLSHKGTQKIPKYEHHDNREPHTHIKSDITQSESTRYRHSFFLNFLAFLPRYRFRIGCVFAKVDFPAVFSCSYTHSVFSRLLNAFFIYFSLSFHLSLLSTFLTKIHYFFTGIKLL